MSSGGRGCDPVSIRLEAEDFKLWYTKFRDVISDLSLVRRVSSIVYNLLNQGCSEEDVIKAVEEILRGVNVDPLAIRRGEFQGLRSDVVEVLKVIFPNATQETKPPFFLGEGSGGRAVKQAPSTTGRVRRARRVIRFRGLELVSWIMVAASTVTAIASLITGERLILGIGLSLALLFLIIALITHIRML